MSPWSADQTALAVEACASGSARSAQDRSLRATIRLGSHAAGLPNRRAASPWPRRRPSSWGPVLEPNVLGGGSVAL